MHINPWPLLEQALRCKLRSSKQCNYPRDSRPSCLQIVFLSVCLKKAALSSAQPFSLVLGYPDSNQERQDQNLQCYHYTIAQLRCKGKAFL